MKILEDFFQFHEMSKLDYKITLIHSNTSLADGSDYLFLNEFLENKMALNSVYKCTDSDVEDYKKAS